MNNKMTYALSNSSIKTMLAANIPSFEALNALLEVIGFEPRPHFI